MFAKLSAEKGSSNDCHVIEKAKAGFDIFQVGRGENKL